MKLFDRLLGLLPYLIGVVMTAAATHILAILAMPHLAPQDSFARLARFAPLNRFVAVPAQTPQDTLLPFEDPATLTAVCRFDVRNGPVRVRADFSAFDGFVAVSFRDRRGATFYSLTDRGGLRNKLDVVLLTRAQLDAVEALDPEDELPQELRLVTPDLEGVVVARSLVVDRLDGENARRRLASATCGLDRPTR